MKKLLRSSSIIAISVLLTHSLAAQSIIPYKDLSLKLKIADGKKKIGETLLVPIYLKSKDAKFDIDKVKFNLINEGKDNDQNLKFEVLKNIPINLMSIRDIEYIEEGYTMKLWVPLDLMKYENWKLSHNQKKGSLSMVIAKTLATNIDVVEKRKKYLEQINKDKANKRK